jgi:hypothetical protein
MIYNFNYNITKDGTIYGTQQKASEYIAGELDVRVTTDKPALEYRISTELKASNQTNLTQVERDHLLFVISSFQIDNYFKGELMKPLTATVIAGIPTEVTLWQLRSQLAIMGLESLVTTTINNFPESTQQEIDTKTIAKTAWEKANVVLRSSSTVAMLQGILGLTSAQVDAIFNNAYLIEA